MTNFMNGSLNHSLNQIVQLQHTVDLFETRLISKRANTSNIVFRLILSYNLKCKSLNINYCLMNGYIKSFYSHAHRKNSIFGAIFVPNCR